MGELLVWVYIVVMWVIVGNGMCYGNNYLYVVVVMVLVSFGSIVVMILYW